MTIVRAAVTALVLVGAIGGTAGADPPGVDARVSAAGKRLEVIISFGPAGKDLQSWSLEQTDVDRRVAIAPRELDRHIENRHTLAVVVLFEGHERVVEAVPGVAAFVDSLRALGPPGSQGAIIVYGKGARIVQPMGPLTALTGAHIGDLRGYRGQRDRDLLRGVELAIGELERTVADRKLLVVIGDGVDPHSDATARIHALSHDHERDLEVYGVRPPDVDDGTYPVIHFLQPRHWIEYRGDPTLMGALLVEAVHDRQLLTFPIDQLHLDGEEHELQLKLDGEDFHEPFVVRVPRAAPPPAPRLAAWPLVMALVDLLCAGLLVIIWRCRPAPL